MYNIIYSQYKPMLTWHIPMRTLYALEITYGAEPPQAQEHVRKGKSVHSFTVKWPDEHSSIVTNITALNQTSFISPKEAHRNID